MPDDTRIEVENIVRGVVFKGKGDHGAAIRNTLCRRYETSKVIEAGFESNTIVKEEQAGSMADYGTEYSLWGWMCLRGTDTLYVAERRASDLITTTDML